MKYTLLFVLLTFFSLLGPTKALAATFYLSPSSGNYKVGDTVNASVLVNSDVAINAGEGSLSYSSDVLEYQTVSTSGSIFTFWTSGPSGSASGVNFGGGLSQPGYTGTSGKLLTVTWKAKAAGTATIGVAGSKILANDGTGANVYSASSGATFTVGAAAVKSTKPTVTVSSTSHSDSAKWYANRKIDLSWTGSKDVTGYIYTLDQTPDTNPNGSVIKTTTQSFDNTADGIWYFHVKGKTSTGFTDVSHFKIQIDTTAPEKFKIAFNKGTMAVNFAAVDTGSGIEKYEASTDGGAAFPIKDGDILPKLDVGNHSLKITAFDLAGNMTTSEGTLSVKKNAAAGSTDKPLNIVMAAGATTGLILLIIIALLVLRLHHKISKHDSHSVIAKSSRRQLESELVRIINTDIPSHDLTSGSVADMKKTLVDKIRVAFDTYD